MTTRGDARGAAISRLRASDDPTAALDADVLLAHVLGITKEALFAHPDEGMTDAQRVSFGVVVERRARGEPVAYLRGWKEFYGLRFAVDARVLIPRPETETLVEVARDFATRSGARLAIDVGTGSGAIAVALAVSVPALRVIATDVSADAVTVARANADANGVGDRVETRSGDLLAPITETVDLVTANLPYLREDDVPVRGGSEATLPMGMARTSLAYEPRVATVAGPDGLAIIRAAIADLHRVLAPSGAAFFECDPPQATEIARLLRDALGVEPRVLRDLAGLDRVVGVERSLR